MMGFGDIPEVPFKMPETLDEFRAPIFVSKEIHPFVEAVRQTMFCVQDEMCKALSKHGIQKDVSIGRQFLITSEEYGEIAEALLEGNPLEAMKEIDQSIAMLVKLKKQIKEGFTSDIATDIERQYLKISAKHGYIAKYIIEDKPRLAEKAIDVIKPMNSELKKRIREVFYI